MMNEKSKTTQQQQQQYIKKLRNRDSPSSKTYPDLVGMNNNNDRIRKRSGAQAVVTITTTVPSMD